jgi:hypothetical protein
MKRGAKVIAITDTQREKLLKLTNSSTVKARVAQCASVILLGGDGFANLQIAQALGIGRIQAACWPERYA